MSEWIKYTGSDEQIAEMLNAKNGVSLRYENGKQREHILKDFFNLNGIREPYEYLICQPHPLADMICQWARTGQFVWIRMTEHAYWISRLGEYDGKFTKDGKVVIKSWYPNWNISGAEYSFQPFEEK